AVLIMKWGMVPHASSRSLIVHDPLQNEVDSRGFAVYLVQGCHISGRLLRVMIMTIGNLDAPCMVFERLHPGMDSALVGTDHRGMAAELRVAVAALGRHRVMLGDVRSRS